MTHLNYSLKELGKTFKLQRKLLKTEMDHNEVKADSWRETKHEWINHVKNNVLCTASSNAR